MYKKIPGNRGFNSMLLVSIISGLFLIQCAKDEESEDCNTRTIRDQYFGYEVWAGDSALWGVQPDWSDYDPMVYYDIDKYYTFIGESTTTQTFSTGDYKYYVLVARWYCCIDAIQFADGSYYEPHMVVDGKSLTTIGGLGEHPAGGVAAGDAARFLGAPDNIAGNLGYKNLCKEPVAFGGFITDNGLITSRGSGITIYVVDNCN